MSKGYFFERGIFFKLLNDFHFYFYPKPLLRLTLEHNENIVYLKNLLSFFSIFFFTSGH